MRIFLLVISFINTLFYVLIYAYYDNVLNMLGITVISASLQNLLKTFILIIAGFSIGIMVMLLLNLKSDRSHFEIKNLLLIGIVPFILLILSLGPVSNLIISRVFSGSEKMQELVFYLLSRNVLWSVWFGFALGTSVRPCFGNRRHKHAVNYVLGENNVMEPKEKL
ncbi:MAG: hypothetical protein MUP02_09420 [Actinobacteria bacterium]|nr:hypothetical protein [Actinomycetota bacterium]